MCVYIYIYIYIYTYYYYYYYWYYYYYLRESAKKQTASWRVCPSREARAKGGRTCSSLRDHKIGYTLAFPIKDYFRSLFALTCNIEPDYHTMEVRPTCGLLPFALCRTLPVGWICERKQVRGDCEGLRGLPTDARCRSKQPHAPKHWLVLQRGMRPSDPLSSSCPPHKNSPQSGNAPSRPSLHAALGHAAAA